MNDAHAPDRAAVEALMARITSDFIDQLNRGEHADIEEYARQYPQIANVIRQALPALQVMRALGSDSVATSDPPGRQDEVAGRLGDYRILREVGRGGMGVVYEAEQISLRRRVALKVLPFAAVLDNRQLQRFKNEAQAAAQLHQNNILPVYAVGCERGVHFYAMQFIDGPTLADVVQELRERTGIDNRTPQSEPRAPSGAPGVSPKGKNPPTLRGAPSWRARWRRPPWRVRSSRR